MLNKVVEKILSHTTVTNKTVTVSLCLAFLLPSLSVNTFARDHLYGALENEALLECDTLSWSSESAEARNCYASLNSLQHPPQIRAEAFWALGDLQSANTQFRDAISQFPEDPRNRFNEDPPPPVKKLELECIRLASPIVCSQFNVEPFGRINDFSNLVVKPV